MFHFFYGSNTYLIKKEVNKLLADFKKKNGEFNIEMLAGDGLTNGKFANIVGTQSFFGDKKLVIVENLLLSKNDPMNVEAIIKTAEKISGNFTPPNLPLKGRGGNIYEVEIYFIEYGVPDKRTSAYKKLSKLSGAREFTEIDPILMAKMVRTKLKQSGIVVDSEAANILAKSFSGDLWRAENESAKLIDYCKANSLSQIGKEELSNISVFADDSKIFDFIDYLSSNKVKSAVMELNKLRKNGEDDFYIFSMIVYQYRNLLSLVDAQERRETGKLKMNPFVMTKLKGLADRYSYDQVVDIYHRLSSIDFEAKTGEAEMGLLIDLFVAKSSSKVI